VFFLSRAKRKASSSNSNELAPADLSPISTGVACLLQLFKRESQLVEKGTGQSLELNSGNYCG
jgi:hypothetical protein